MSALERLWRDTADIYRYADVTVNKVTKSVESLLYSGVKCQYSKGSLTDVGTDGEPTLISSHTLFCGLVTDIKEGDKIIVTQRNGKTIVLSVGEGFPYTSHQEFSVKRDETA